MNKKKSIDSLGSYFKRCGQDTPPFFRKLRALGLMVIAAEAALLFSTVPIFECLTELGSYLIVAGSVAVAISQAAVGDNSDCENV